MSDKKIVKGASRATKTSKTKAGSASGPLKNKWMIYGANGYSAQLAIEKAVSQGRFPTQSRPDKGTTSGLLIAGHPASPWMSLGRVDKWKKWT